MIENVILYQVKLFIYHAIKTTNHLNMKITQAPGGLLKSTRGALQTLYMWPLCFAPSSETVLAFV